MNFKAIWICRDGGAFKIRPVVPVLMALEGFWNCGWLAALNHSERNSTRFDSVTAKVLKAERSKLTISGPVSTLAPEFPNGI